MEAWGVESKKRVEAFLPVLEKRLSESTYVATEHFTIVDITAFIFVTFAVKGLELAVFEQFSHIEKWYKQIANRAAFQPL